MNLQLWYNQAVAKGVHTYVDGDCDFLIYKGFKISIFPDRDLIQDVRVNDFYDSVSESDMKVLLEQGFIKGCDSLSYERNKKRFVKYISTLEKLYENRDTYNEKFNTNPTFYEKRLKNCEDGVANYTDLLFFYKAKIVAYEEIYNVKQKFIEND